MLVKSVRVAAAYARTWQMAQPEKPGVGATFSTAGLPNAAKT
jgi:hypothetical protein